MPGELGKTLVDEHGAEIRIEHRRAERILETASEDRLIDERVHWPAQLSPFRRKVGPVGGGYAGHDQGFEIRPARAALTEPRRQQIRHFVLGICMRFPITGMLAKGSRLQ